MGPSRLGVWTEVLGVLGVGEQQAELDSSGVGAVTGSDNRREARGEDAPGMPMGAARRRLDRLCALRRCVDGPACTRSWDVGIMSKSESLGRVKVWVDLKDGRDEHD